MVLHRQRPDAAGTAATVDLHGELGQIIVDAQGRTLYLFEADKGGKSSCDGPCAAAWPPYVSNGAPQAAMGASGALVGTTTRADGTTQVTYGGHPLYYFVGDKAPGDTTGQDIDQFGAKWYVVAKDGKKIDNAERDHEGEPFDRLSTAPFDRLRAHGKLMAGWLALALRCSAIRRRAGERSWPPPPD